MRPERLRRFLPSTEVRAIAQDARGFLWLGTDRGLARFDGIEFRWQEGHPRVTEAIAAVVPGAAEDELWVGLLQPATVLHLHDGRIDDVATLGEPPLVTLLHMARGHDGVLWVASTNGLYRVDPRTRQVTRLVASEETPRVNAVVERAPGELWIGTPLGLGRVHGGSRIELHEPAVGVASLALAPDRRLVLAEPHGVTAVRPEDGQREPLVPPSEAPIWPSLTTIDPDGTIWLVISNALHVLRDGALQPIPSMVGIEYAAYSGLRDHEGNLWLGTSTSGLLQVKSRQPFKLLTTADGLPDPVVFTIAPSHAGGVWLSTVGGLVRWPADGPPATIPVRPHAWPTELRGMFEDTDGTLWVSTFQRGLLRIRGTVVEDAIAALGLPQGGVRLVYRDRSGTLWISYDSGTLVADRPGQRRVWTREETPCPAPAFGACEATDGTLWLATSYAGACAIRREGAGWTLARRGTGELPDERLHTAACTDSGDVWFGTVSAGLIRLRDERWSTVGTAQGLRFRDVGQIVHDRHGYTWVSSRRGIQRFASADLDAAADGRLSRIVGQFYDVDDGMGGNTVVWAFPPAGTLTREGEVWFPTLRGAVAFTDPAGITPPRPAVPVIERVVFDGQPRSPQARMSLPLATAAGHLEIAYAAPAFEVPHRLRFRYRLAGLDQGWIDAGTRRVAYYTNLPAGRFAFTVEALVDGQPSVGRAELELVLVPPFHRTRTFMALMAALGGLVVLGLFRMRLWHERARFAAVTDERNRIARDMHDTLEQSLVASRLQLDAAETALARPEVATRHIGRARELVERSLREAKSSIWALRAGASDAADLRAALSATIGQALLGTRVAFHLHTDGVPYRLEPEAERQLVRIAQEAATNALKHGAPSALRLALSFAAEGVTLVCQDDGRGFDAGEAGTGPGGKPGAHYGLRGMHERAQALAGHLRITSQPGTGTTVTAFVPARWRRRGAAVADADPSAPNDGTVT